MFNAEDLRWEVLNSVEIPQRTQTILDGLGPLFTAAAQEGESQIILRFRCKGGITDTVKKSLNTDVIDIFTSPVVTDNTVSILKSVLGYSILHIKKPFDMFVVSWGEIEEMQAVRNVNIVGDTIIDEQYSRTRLIILKNDIILTLNPACSLPRGFEFEIIKADTEFDTVVQCTQPDLFRDGLDSALIMQDAKIMLLPNNKFAALHNITEIEVV